MVSEKYTATQVTTNTNYSRPAYLYLLALVFSSLFLSEKSAKNRDCALIDGVFDMVNSERLPMCQTFRVSLALSDMSRKADYHPAYRNENADVANGGKRQGDITNYNGLQ